MSFMISLPFLSLGVIAMVLSLNLNGYIHDKESPIYFATLSKFAEPVSVFSTLRKKFSRFREKNLRILRGI